MINIYSENETNFEHNGLATLNPISAEFSPAVNGAWSLIIVMPYDKTKKYQYLMQNNIIVADVGCIREQAKRQMFRIYDLKKNLSTITIIAFPIGMEATYDAPIEELKISTCSGSESASIINDYIRNVDENTKYTITSDVTKRASSQFENTNLIATISGSNENSFINKWGGEVIYDNFNIKILKEAGEKVGFPIRYGRNLTGIEQNIDMSNVISRIYPISNDDMRLHTYPDTSYEDGQTYVENEAPDAPVYPYDRSAFIKVDYELLDTDEKSYSNTAIATRRWIEELYDAIYNKAEELWEGAKDDLTNTYCPAYIQTLMEGDEGIIQYTQARYAYTNQAWQSLVKSLIKQGLEWIKKENLADWKWIARQGWFYGTKNADGSMKNYPVNQYIYSYSDSKWYHFGESGLMDYDQSEMPQETIDLLNTYDWRSDSTGQYYGDGVSGSGNFFKNAWIENRDGTHSWVGDDGYYIADYDDSETWSWSKQTVWMYGESVPSKRYGSKDESGKFVNQAKNQYIYSYADSKWYHFDANGLMDYNQSEMSQETIDLFNTYDWHTDETGKFYGNGQGSYFTNAWIENRDGTHSWVNAEGYYVDDDLTTWVWETVNGRYARNEYVEVDKRLEFFGDDGIWQDWAGLTASEMGWYQIKDTTSPHFGKWWYGSIGRNYAHNEFVYEQVDGVWKEWWYDEEGWYDESSSGDSAYDWRGNDTDGWWFGEADASTGDKSKYLHDRWAVINGDYYWFNSDGYISKDAKHVKYDWGWSQIQDEVTGRYWYGSKDVSFDRKWISNQWLEIDGEWYYFDADGYATKQEDKASEVISWFSNALWDSVTPTITAKLKEAYDLLYSQMVEWCNDQFAKGLDRPNVSITVDLVDLSKTTEYAEYQNLEKIYLGDSVECVDAIHGISSSERVVGLTYDVIRGYNTKVTIGQLGDSLSSILSVSYKGSGGGETKLIAGDNVVINGNVISVSDNVGAVIGLQDATYKGASVVNGNVAILDNVGTKVVANPEGTPTADLTKLRVEDEIYSIPQGGGGGGNVVDMGETEYAGITPEEDTAYFVYGDGESRLDENYNYYTHNGQTGQIIVRVYHEGESDEEIVWFFHGYSQPAGDMAIPSNLLPYYKVTTNQNAFSYLTGTTTRNGYVIIWRDKTIAVTYVSTSSYSTDVVDAVIVMGSGVNQDNPYTSPYVNVISDLKSRYIYFNNKEYANKLKTYSTTPKVVAKDVDGNSIYEVYYEYQSEAGTTNFVVVDNLPIPSGKTLADLKIVSSKVSYLPANTNTWYEGNFYGTSNYYFYYYIQRSSDTYGKKYTLTIRTTKGSSQSNPTNLIAIIRYKF